MCVDGAREARECAGVDWVTPIQPKMAQEVRCGLSLPCVVPFCHISRLHSSCRMGQYDRVQVTLNIVAWECGRSASMKRGLVVYLVRPMRGRNHSSYMSSPLCLSTHGVPSHPASVPPPFVLLSPLLSDSPQVNTFFWRRVTQNMTMCSGRV